MTCNYCGKEIRDGSAFCKYCGGQLNNEEERSVGGTISSIEMTDSDETNEKNDNANSGEIAKDGHVVIENNFIEEQSNVDSSHSAAEDNSCQDITNMPVNQKRMSLKNKKMILIILFVIMIAIISLILINSNKMSYDTEIKTVQSDCESGSVFDVDYMQFSEKFHECLVKSAEITGINNDEIEFLKLESRWDNDISVQSDIEDKTGKSIKSHSILFMDNQLRIGLKEIDGRVNSVSVIINDSVSSDETPIVRQLSAICIMALGNKSYEEAVDIINKLGPSLEYAISKGFVNVVLVDDGVMYFFEIIEDSSELMFGYNICAVSDNYVKQIVNEQQVFVFDLDNDESMKLLNEVYDQQTSNTTSAYVDSTNNKEEISTVPSKNELASDNETASELDSNLYIVSTKSDDLRIRENSDINSKVIGGIPKGTVIVVKKEDNGFAYITYKGVTGWVSKDFLVEYDGEAVEVTTKKSESSSNKTTKSSKDNYSDEAYEIGKKVVEDVADYAIDKGVDIAVGALNRIF